MPRIIGLDVSLTDTGVAVINPFGLTVDRVRSKPTGSTYLEASMRIDTICAQIEGRLMAAQPELVVIESPAFASKTGQAHTRAWLWGRVFDLARRHADVLTATPQAVKMYATGAGNADKDEVLAAVVRRYPNLAVTNNNTADAVILAAMGSHYLGEPIANAPTAKTHLRALDKLAR
ncbi:RuvC-like resolvase [Gordonia phage LittleMunchkin]|nr:RuvC-like resolvase [Gordonia phage LittleMunchkin]